MTRFLICGAPRSGTLWLSEVFNQLGYRTGHETVIGVGWNGTDGYHPEAWDNYDGEVSHAIAYTNTEPWPLLHVVRDPIMVITSILNLEAIEPIEEAYALTPTSEAPPARAVDFLMHHSDLVEGNPGPYMWTRLEDITPTHLIQIVKHLTGDNIDEQDTRRALKVRTDLNTATERLGTNILTWTPNNTREWLMSNYRDATEQLLRRYRDVP